MTTTDLPPEREGLREAGHALAMAAGALVVATDSNAPLRDHRIAVLNALEAWEKASTHPGRPTREEEEIARLRMALHEIDIEASNTIPPDGKDAAFAALNRIIRIINPFRLSARATQESERS